MIQPFALERPHIGPNVSVGGPIYFRSVRRTGAGRLFRATAASRTMRRVVFVIVLVKAGTLQHEPDIGRNLAFHLRTTLRANLQGFFLDGLKLLESPAFFTTVIVRRHGYTAFSSPFGRIRKHPLALRPIPRSPQSHIILGEPPSPVNAHPSGNPSGSVQKDVAQRASKSINKKAHAPMNRDGGLPD